VSRYAFDDERGMLAVSWATGAGDVARDLAPVDAALPHAEIRQLTGALTELSAAMWRTYSHPVGAADSLEPNTEGWRREGEREAFEAIHEALIRPNLPPDGVLTQSHLVTEEAAQRVGRVLYALGDAALTERVAADVDCEVAAVEQAERGELSGRARQAVALSRADASPVQVQAADRLLHDDPLGPDALFTEVDPAAAAIAAAHWLQAAAEVTSEVSGMETTEVVMEADNITALPHETPTVVLELMDLGGRPHDVVTGLLRDALDAAEGAIPDIGALRDQIDQVERTAEEYGESEPGLRAILFREIRTTPLDPMRPAHDLLEDLLAGLYGCWMLYDEHTLDTAGDAGSDDDARYAAAQQRFTELVRLAAAQHRDRLP
jgi:hypothetical protein